MTRPRLQKAYIEKLAEIAAEETLDRDTLRVIRIAQRRQQIYAAALPAARLGKRIERLDWWSRTIKILAVAAVGVAVAAYAAPVAAAYLANSAAGAWSLSRIALTPLALTATVGSKTIPIASSAAAFLVATGVAQKLTSGQRWLVPNLTLKGPWLVRETSAMEASTLIGMAFDAAYRTHVAYKIDAIERTIIGMWQGWSDVKLIPSIIQGEYAFVMQIDAAMRRQLLAEGASSETAHLRKVEMSIAFWKKIEDELTAHRIAHNYRGTHDSVGTIQALKGQAAELKAQLDLAIPVQVERSRD